VRTVKGHGIANELTAKITDCIAATTCRDTVFFNIKYYLKFKVKYSGGLKANMNFDVVYYEPEALKYELGQGKGEILLQAGNT
jgi:hypothetical protein